MGNKKANKRLTHDVIWKLWDFIGTDNWNQLLQEYKPNLNFHPTGHTTLKGCCVHPDHHDSDPSFYIHTARGFARCYGGSCNYFESNPLKLIAHIRGCTYPEALQYVQNTYKPRFLPAKAMEELEAQRKSQEVKKEIFAAAHQLMCEAIATPEDKAYAYAQQGLHWLTNVRKLSKDVLHALPLAIMPPLGTLTNKINDRYFITYKRWKKEGSSADEPVNHAQAATNYFADYVRDPVFTGGVLFPLHANQTEISNFKLRSPDSSKKFIITKDEYSSDLGMYGLGWNHYKMFWGQGSKQNYTHIVEGEFDALALMAYYVTTGKVQFPVIAAGGGGGAPHIERCLRVSGIKTVYLVGDTPAAKGNDVVQKWLEQIHELHVRIFHSWDMFPGSSDLDDVMQREDPKKVFQLLWHDQTKTFAHLWDWAATQAGEVIDRVEDHDFREKLNIAASHGKYVNQRLEAAKYVEVISNNYNLNESLLQREITARDGSELGFIKNCVDALKEFLFVVGSYTTKTGRFLKVYNTKNKNYHEILLASSKSVISELAPTVGQLHEFVTKHVGQPAFLDFPTPDTDARLINRLNDHLAEYMELAFLDMTQDAPDFTTAKRLKQGYHCLRDKKEGLVEYIVCGTDVFKAQREGPAINYTKLEGPADAKHNTIFDVDANTSSTWYPGGLSVDKLEAGKKVDLQRLYNDLVEVYDVGYCFKNQTVTAQLLAALVLCYPIMDAFERPVLVFITGDTHSGKSSLLSTLTGFNYKGIQLLLASQGYESYSAAGVAGYADCDSRLLALDEFESGDSERGLHVSKIMEMFRGLVSGQADRVRGRADGTAFTQTFRLPVIFSAIKGAERPQDLNRMLTIEMQKVPQKVNPVHVIQDTIGVDRIKEMAHEIAVGMYPHAQDLARLEIEVREEFIQLQKTNPKLKIEWRLASSLFAIAAMLKFLGKDWIRFFEQYIDDNTYTIQQTAVASESHGTLNAIMRNPCIKRAEGPDMTISQMLVSPELRADINTSNRGVYFDEATKTILFLVDQGTSLIPHHLRGRTTGAQLKILLERHPTALSPSAIERSGVLYRVGRYLGAGIKLENVTVVDANPWLHIPDANPLDTQNFEKKPTKPSVTATSTPETDVSKKRLEETANAYSASLDSWDDPELP